MKKTFAIVISVLILTISAIIMLWVFSLQKNPYKNQQDLLANEMGVRITDYPYEDNFPLGYFYANLKPDMTVDEIHKIVQGYEKAYRCRSSGAVYYYKEVFYYFSPDDNKALRFQIFFNKQEKFTDFQSEDDDSRMISINNCELGIIGR